MNPTDCSRARICDNPNLMAAAESLASNFDVNAEAYAYQLALRALCDECPLKVAVETMEEALTYAT